MKPVTSQRRILSSPRIAVLAAATISLFFLSALAAAQTESVLYAFTGAPDGGVPKGNLVLDSQGNLYGTTYSGGSDPNCFGGCGIVFAVSSTGTETILHNFTGNPDGNSPAAGLLLDAKGNLYGTAETGGETGGGVVFRLAPDRTEKVLFGFFGESGAFPISSLVRDPQGNLYGTATEGGANRANCSSGCGTVFKVTPTGTPTVLYNFAGGTDGANPQAGLVRDASGNLYGTTNYGGAFGWGTVFEVTPAGIETILYSFTGGDDGAYPLGNLIRDAAGNLYGTASQGGPTGKGTVFKITPTGAETTLYMFKGVPDGSYPSSGLIRDGKGNFYGTTELGGRGSVISNVGSGTVFKLTPAGKETVLYSFTGAADGASPIGGLVRDKLGNLYGTTVQGGVGAGSAGYGVVFKVAP